MWHTREQFTFWSEFTVRAESEGVGKVQKQNTQGQDLHLHTGHPQCGLQVYVDSSQNPEANATPTTGRARQQPVHLQDFYCW